MDATPEFAPDVLDATQPAKLVVTPPAGIPQGSEFTVKVSYSGTPKEITDADESYEGCAVLPDGQLHIHATAPTR